MSQKIDAFWYGRKRPLWFLWPLAWLYTAVSRWRYRRFRAGHLGEDAGLPVIVVGNITAGGTGKSPLVLSVVRWLVEQGWRPVILSRGYGGDPETYPLRVTSMTPVGESGDEPAMLALEAQVPVLVDPVRIRAARYAKRHDLGDILVSDDGLQHYGLRRDIEIAVLDGSRGLGNGAPIPVGPLREGPDRLSTVDLVVANGATVSGLPSGQSVMTLEPRAVVNLATGEEKPLDWLSERSVTAVAGIGNPQRFFRTLKDLGANVVERPLPDHHRFREHDIEPVDQTPVIMTAKDAVKCKEWASSGKWYLDVEASLSDEFWTALQTCLRARQFHPSSEQEQHHG